MVEDAVHMKEMAELVEKFFSEANEIIASLTTNLDAKAPPPRLYHYTNDAGLRGILESGNLWLTDIFYLNDPAELRHGVSHAVDALQASEKDNLPERHVFAKSFEAFQNGGIEASAHYFVGCFSGANDDLGQWRAYADDGRGFALGFDGELLEKTFSLLNGEPIPSNMSFPVTYDDETLRQIQTSIVDAALPYISAPRGRRLNSLTLNDYMKELSVAYSVAALRASLFFKHPAYEGEQEYRFIQIQEGGQSAQNVKFRQRPYSLARYVEFAWRTAAASALKEIVIGPSADAQKATLFANDCLRAFHNSHPESVSITLSKIPYRSSN